jgi:hypothetical protein
VAAKLHLAEDALALHLLLQRLEGLVDIIVTDENLHACSSRSWVMRLRGGTGVSPRRLAAACSRNAGSSPQVELIRRERRVLRRINP